MKKTGSMILSLALATILVSSLSSGTVYGHDKKDPTVVTLECLDGNVLAADTSLAEFSEDLTMMSCVEAIAFLLKNRYKLEGSGMGFAEFVGTITSYTFVKK